VGVKELEIEKAKLLRLLSDEIYSIKQEYAPKIRALDSQIKNFKTSSIAKKVRRFKCHK